MRFQVPSVVSEVSIASHRSVHGGKRAQGRNEATPFDALLDTTASETEPKKTAKADKPEKAEKPERAASSRTANENESEPREPAAAGTETEAEPAAEAAAPVETAEETADAAAVIIDAAAAEIETTQTVNTDATAAVPAVTVETPAQPAPVPVVAVAVVAPAAVAVPVVPQATAPAADAEIAGVAPVGDVALPEKAEAAPQTAAPGAPAETVTPEEMPAEAKPQIVKAAGEKPAEDKPVEAKVKADVPVEDGKPAAPKLEHADTAEKKTAPATEGPAKPEAPIAKPKLEVEAPRIDNAATQRDHSAIPAAASGGNPGDVVALATAQAQAVHATGPAVSANRSDQAAVAIPLNGLAVEIAAQQRAGKSRFEIRLDPPELGRIDVRLDMDKDGNVTSRLMVERAETLDLLRRDAHQLERALNQAGLKTSDNALEFQLRDQGFANNEQNNRQNGREAAQIIIPDDEATVLEAKRGYGRLLGLGNGLDISV
jgi:flagellar hook-length control protein FliK